MATVALQASKPATRKVPMAKIGQPFAEAATAFKPMTRIPPGHLVIEETSNQPPMVRAGEFVVVDPAQRAPVDNGVYAIQWHEGSSVHILVTQWKEVARTLAWWIRGPAGGLTDGPYTADMLAETIIGRVVGVLSDKDGRHLTALWGPGTLQGRPQRLLTSADLPDQYVSQADGHCMEPLYHHNDKLEFTQIDRPRPGDAVAIWRRPEYHQEGQYQCLIKRLVTPLPRQLPTPSLAPSSVVIVEALNPPKRFVVLLDEVIGVHKCNGVYGGLQWKPSPDEIRAIAAEQRSMRAT